MAEPPDFAALARRYLDLWESQLTALGSNPALLDQIARTVAAMGAALATASAAGRGVGETAGPAAGDEGERDGKSRNGRQGAADRDEGSSADAAARPSAAAAAPADGDAGLVELARHVAALERRLERIEAALAAKPGAAGTRSRKRRS
jgi:hypothetical protein